MSRFHLRRVHGRSLVSILLSGLMATMLAGCPNTPDPPRNGAASVTFNTVMAAGGAPKCTVNTVYTYEPISPKDTDGSSTSVQHTKAEELPSNGNSCTFTDSALALKQGSWRITSSAFGACTVDLHEGFNSVTLGADGACSSF